MKKTFLVIFLNILFLTSYSQKKVVFTNNPAEFIEAVSNYLKGSTKVEIKATGEEFNAFWSSNLNTTQQQKIANIGVLIQRKNYTYSHFNDFFIALMRGSEVSGFNLDEYLDVAEKVFTYEKNIPILNFISISRQFLADSSLVKTNFNAVKSMGGSFKFEYANKIEEKTEVDNLLEKAKLLEESNKKVNDAFEELSSDDEDDWDATDAGNWESDWGNEEEVVVQEVEKNVDLNKFSEVGYQKPEQPKIFGPIIQFTDMDLVFASKFDTSVVEKTSGAFMFTDKMFVANGGKMDWRSAGLEEGSCYVEFGEWNYDMKGTSFRAENVKLTYPEKLKGTVEGIFEYATQKITDRNLATYPRFMSYHSVSEYANLGENISLTGGFSLEGRKINTESVDAEIGVLKVKHDGKERFRAKGKRFEILDSVLTSKNVGTILFIGLDSIKHPSMSLEYGLNDNRLQLRKGRNTADAPFQDTYHKVEITAEKLDWTLGDSLITMSIMSAPNQIPVKVKSYNYFNNEDYVRLSGIGSFHPLQSLVYYAKKEGRDEVYVSEVAKEFKKPEATYAGAMRSLAQKGFVLFDARSGKITLKDKAYFYVDARRGKTDFDNINISSLSGAKNAYINLDNNELTLTGVKRFYISDSLTVFNEPRDGIVIIKKNRDMLLHGKLVAGKYFFVCDSMEFNYNRFEIQLNGIDSIQFSFLVEQKEEDKGKRREEKELGLAVDYASGMLYIDKPNNKSTRIKNPGYPFFDAVTGAQVYFSDERILDGVYSKDVYFQIPPFDIDSLNSVDPNKANFKGTFHSGGIFPEFEDVLIVRTDKNLSFGFIHTIPEEGYKIYQKEGTIFKGNIDMSDFGMHGNGYIEHITSKLYSDDFIYYPDSITTEKGSKVDMLQGNHKKTTFPNMKVENYKMMWNIQEDSLHLWNNDSTKQFNLYTDKANFNGRLTIKDEGLLGQGVATTNHAHATSNQFGFKDEYFIAQYSDFYVNSEIEGKPTLRTTDAKLRFDMVKNIAEFGPEEDGFASTEFPFMQYKTSLSKGVLKIDEDIVEMEMEKGEDLENSYFYSTNLEQDSLVFNATRAICDLKKYKLDIFGVPFIRVADSKVIPDSGEVVIFENAEMKPFKNAKLIIDTINEYHNLHSGEIEVTSRIKVFRGEAKYDFINSINDTFNIVFDDFLMIPYSQKKKEDKFYNTAKTDIEEEENFYISPRIQYKGGAFLNAQKQYLGFDGYVKLDLSSSDISDYFVFKSPQVDPENVQINMANPTDADGTPLVTGIFVDESIDEIYTNFVALKENPTNPAVIQAVGALSYDPDVNEFTITDTVKLSGKTQVGNVFTYNDSTTQIKYEGSFDFFTNTKDFQLFSAGNGYGNVKQKDYYFNIFSTLQFRLPSTLLTMLGTTIFDKTRDEYVAIYDLDSLSKPIAELSNDKTVEYIKSQMQITGSLAPLYEYSPKFNKTFVFSNIQMHWNPEERSFWTDDSIGLSNIGKTNINVQTHGKIEFHKNANGDELNMIIAPDSSSWFYFSYRDNLLYIISSEFEFNKEVFKRSKPIAERKEKEFLIQTANYVEKEEFIHKYITKFYKQDRKEPNYDSLEIAFSQLLATFSTDKSVGKPIKDEPKTDDGFETFDEEFEQAPPKENEVTTPKEESKEEPEKDVKDEFSDEVLEIEFENSTTNKTQSPKKKKEKAPKPPKEEPKEEPKENSENSEFEEF